MRTVHAILSPGEPPLCGAESPHVALVGDPLPGEARECPRCHALVWAAFRAWMAAEKQKTPAKPFGLTGATEATFR